ncbi:hypothetical protein B0H14DRAFT_2787348 [Mycena olivaceomarginata]|nr:hypothetical protein B0H14DRAFT_2787348 [Mycena olivaceomarginata]
MREIQSAPTLTMPSLSDTVEKILKYTTAAANALQDVPAATQIPFVQRICGLSLTIIPMVQNVKSQKDRCFRVVEAIHYLLCILISLSMHSADLQTPRMLGYIAHFTLILQKIDSCLRAPQDELTAQLGSCKVELKATLSNFTMKQGTIFASALVEFSIDTERRHQELLELMSSQSDSFDDVSSIEINSLNASSDSFSLLPAFPKIFHGRDSELKGIVNTLLKEPARVAILGPGGMGKTTLAVAALHHPEVVDKYPTCYFISCDSAGKNESLVAIIGAGLGLEATCATAKHITPWEPVDDRAKVEEFLSLLTDVQHLALLITMRGAERPGKVQWTHPFLHPLVPLTQVAAHQTFIEIADSIHNNLEVDQLLDITDNIPLAVQLIATLAGSEGCEPTLERWKLERTAMLSDGTSKRSNLEISIQLSLSSPRMLSSPCALQLLSLMSLLSDGISDHNLVQSRPPIPEILKCKATLLRTSLAYVDHAGQLKLLAPIREYIHNIQPPSPPLVRPLRTHFIDLLKLWRTVMDSSSFVDDLIPHLLSNLGNLHNILLQGLDFDHEACSETTRGIILLNDLHLYMDLGLNSLMLRLLEILDQMKDHDLHGKFIIGTFKARHFYEISDPDKLMAIGLEHFQMTKDLEGEARLYTEAAIYYAECAGDLKIARRFHNHALSLASQCQSDGVKVRGLAGLTFLEFLCGNYKEGNVWGELSSIRWQALCHQGLGDFQQSLQLANDRKKLMVRVGMQGSQIESMLMRTEAEVYLIKGEYAKARQIHEVLVHQTSAVLAPIQHGFSLVNIAFLDIATSASAEIVLRNLDKATSIFRKVQHLQGLSACEHCHADLHLREGDIVGACNEYIRLFSGLQSSDNELSCLCLGKLVDPIYPVHSDKEVARWAIVFLAFTMRPSGRNVPAMHHALRCLGDIFAQQGMVDEPLSILGIALEGFTRMDMHRGRAECMRTIGDISMRCGDLRNASDMWTAARSLFERAEQTRDVAGINKRLMSSTEQSSRDD